jgi:hypothetical protein
MKYLKHINEMNSDGPNIREIEELCKEFLEPSSLSRERFGYQIQSDGKVFVAHGREVFIKNPSITELPFQFSDRVDGSIYIIGANLTTLQGLPRESASTLSIGKLPKLTSLEGCPKRVNLFAISNTSITNLIGGPRECQLYACRENKLTSLEGAPEEVDKFTCADNPLTNLRGAPKRINQKLVISKCKYLTSLEGIPVMTNVHLEMSHCTEVYDPTPLKGSQFIGNYNNLHNCPINYLLDLFRNSEKSDDEDFKNFIDSLDYNYIRIRPGVNGGKVCLNYFRLGEALKEFDYPIRLEHFIQSFPEFPYTIIDDEGNPINIDPY